MTNADRYQFADFTRDNYRRLLRLAAARYLFRRMTDFRRDEPFVIWRHDLDSSVHSALKLARIEAEEGVRATYLVHVHSDFYNPFETEVSNCIRSIAALGHEMGIHFDTHYYGIEKEEQIEEPLVRERRFCEEMFGCKFPVFSFHVSTPFTQACRRMTYGTLINANAEYFQTEVGYCSDSNGFWRFRRLEDVLRNGQDTRLQVLTHPEWWQDEVMSPRERIERCIRGRADRTRTRYEDNLLRTGRLNID